LIRILKQSAYKFGYLFITAAWLYTVSFLFTNYFSFDATPEKVAKNLSSYVAKKETRFNDLINDSVLVQAIVSGKAHVVQSKFKSDETGIFVYRINAAGLPQPVYWNTNTITVNDSELYKPDGYYAASHANGYFELIKKTITKNSRQYIIIGLIPVYWAYTIEFEDVQTKFAAYDNLSKSYTLTADTGIPVFNGNGKILFYAEQKEKAFADQPGTVSIFLRVVAIILLMIFINSLATELSTQYSFFAGFLFLFIVIISGRLVTFFFPFPFDYKELNLFFSGLYASSTLNPSLGDLLINSILFYWMISFIKFNAKRIGSGEKILNDKGKKFIGILALAILPLFTIGMASFLSSLVKDSATSFDVTNFFSMNIYTIVSFIIICFLLLSFFYVTQLLVRLSFLTGFSMYWRIIVLLSFTLLVLSFKLITENDTGLNFSLVGWLLIFYIFIDVRKDEIPLSFYASSSFMSWSIFLIASVSALLIYQNRTLEMEKRRQMADKIYSQSDPSIDFILNIALSRFSQNFIGDKFRRFYDSSENRLLKDSINEDFNRYIANFDTRVYTYDKEYRPLYNRDSISYNVIKSIIINQGRFTTSPDLYYYENSPDKFSYIYEKNIFSTDSNTLGHVFVLIRPKAYEDEELVPLLFRQLVKDQPLLGEDYFYAVYDKYNLQKSSTDYDFPDMITKPQVPKGEYEFKERDGNSELWYNAGNNKVIVVVRKNNWFPESITFFAYLFGILIILVLVQHFSYLVLKTHFKWNEIKKVFRFNIRTQIQTIIVGVSVISFLVIGAATISFFVNRFNVNNEEKLRSTAQIVVKEIEPIIKNNNGIINGQIQSSLFGQQIIKIAQSYNTDINFFDINGNLEISSQSYIYDNQILSKKMHPAALYALRYGHSTQHIQEENVINYNFLSIYVPVKNDNDQTIAYLNLPYINSQNELHQEISNFVVTLINLNALIFILAGGIALWVTRRITSSFTLIGNKMKAISFGTENEEIEWKKDDELGELVTEYNKMVKKLAESAQALARSEREGAWREMARQVAHEIKNPLTPMKLSIQYLQRAIDNNAPNVKDLSKQVAHTLVEQIDQLSKIAGDFSQFANITNVRQQVFDLSNVIAAITNLFSNDERVNIAWKKEDGPFMVKADKTQINRLFTNLIKNAIEAYSSDEKAAIIIQQKKKENEIIVSIHDEGHGIPETMQKKIFAPNFTTKSSGTGLGLAICKGIVEKANGNIWFQTKENEGTTFYVSLPLVHEPEVVAD
jgi:two-component system nitrogen regulation sensor histidine kinase NtrY